MANRVVHFEIPAKDLKRASKFYADAFGWDMQDQGGDYGGYIVAVSGPPIPTGMENIGINGGVYQVDEHDQENLNAFRCVIGVDDIDKAIEDVKKAGGKVNHITGPDGKDLGEKTEIPTIGMWAKCLDTEGNLFSVLEPDPNMPKT